MSAEDPKCGDVVRLKCGGPMMVVRHVYLGLMMRDATFDVAWHDERGRMQVEYKIPHGVLRWEA